MTGRVENWLPADAFSDDAVAGALFGPLERWSKRWFAKPARVTAVRRDGAQPAAQPQVFAGRHVKVEMTGLGKRRLLEAALDVQLAQRTPGEGDHAALDALSAAMANDLVAALDALCGTDDRGKGAVVSAVLLLAGSEIFAATVPLGALVPAIKALAGGARRPADAPRRRTEALAQTRVTAEAVLGRVELALGDLDDLAVGDVVVLDRTLHEPVELRLAGGRSIGRGKLGRNGGHAAIQL